MLENHIVKANEKYDTLFYMRICTITQNHTGHTHYTCGIVYKCLTVVCNLSHLHQDKLHVTVLTSILDHKRCANDEITRIDNQLQHSKPILMARRQPTPKVHNSILNGTIEQLVTFNDKRCQS